MSKYIMSSSPHVKAKHSTSSIMIDVCIALIPATIMAIVFFGLNAVSMIVLSIIGCLLGEFIYKKIMKKSNKDIFSEFDFTSLVTGLLLGLNMPPLSIGAFYVPVLGGLFAIIVVKMIFGGTGFNFVNPALGGRIFAIMSFTILMTQNFALPNIASLNGYTDLATGATPLTQLLQGSVGSGAIFNMGITNLDLFLGTGVAGSIGETSKAALLLGAIYLAVKGIIDIKLPIIYIAVTGLTAVALNGFNFNFFLPSILSGGLFLGALFMATDYVTTPNTKLGNYIYFIALGLVTALLRDYTKTEVVSYAIVLMNLCVPLMDKFIVPKPFGFQKAKKEGK